MMDLGGPGDFADLTNIFITFQSCYSFSFPACTSDIINIVLVNVRHGNYGVSCNEAEVKGLDNPVAGSITLIWTIIEHWLLTRRSAQTVLKYAS